MYPAYLVQLTIMALMDFANLQTILIRALASKEPLSQPVLL